MRAVSLYRELRSSISGFGWIPLSIVSSSLSRLSGFLSETLFVGILAIDSLSVGILLLAFDSLPVGVVTGDSPFLDSLSVPILLRAILFLSRAFPFLAMFC